MMRLQSRLISIATVCALALAGCAGSRIDIAATSFSTISADTDQKVIEELLGSPIATEQASDLTVVAYHFNQGYHSSYHAPKGGIGGGAGANPAAVILLAMILGVAKVADYASAIADARESQRAQLAAIFDNNQKLVYATKLAKDEPDISARMKTIAARYASARAGDVEAQFALGKDALIPQQKIKMLKKAAANGDGKIKYEVAKLTTTKAEKIGLLREAASLEYAPALFDLGNAYYLGSGVPRDQTQAISWWRKAAAHNYVQAYIKLGEAYRFGKGVPRDFGEAEVWFLKAASAGNEEAQRLDDERLETSSVATAAQTANRPKLIIELVPEEDNRETKQLITKFREPLAAAVSQLGGFDVVYAGTEVASTPARRLVLTLGIGAPDNTGPGISYGLANNFRATGALQDSQTGEALKRFTITKERPYDVASERLLIESSARQIAEAIS
jgi:hypothetical protein